MPETPSSTFMPAMVKEAQVDLKSGVKIRIYRQEPFKFMGEIHKWLEGLNIGSVESVFMDSDANGWLNFVVAYREYREPAVSREKLPDPIVVLYDTVALLKDTVETINQLTDHVEKLSKSVQAILQKLFESTNDDRTVVA